MTPSNLFNIILKVIGIFLLKDALLIIPNLIAILISGIKSSDVFLITIFVGEILAYSLLFYSLLFRTNYWISKLKLTKGFDEAVIPLAIHRSSILSISIIVIGGLLLVHEIPNLFTQLFNYYNLKAEKFMSEPRISYSVLAGSKVLIGLLLVFYQRYIVNFIEFRRGRLIESQETDPVI